MAVCADWDPKLKGALLPTVAVAVFICRGDQVLVCRRRYTTSYNEYGLPGGFLEFGETLEECAIREVEAESALQIEDIKLGTVSNTILLDELRPSHYLTVFMTARLKFPEDKPDTLKPEKCDGWLWVDWPKVPAPVFKPLQELLDVDYDPFLQKLKA